MQLVNQQMKKYSQIVFASIMLLVAGVATAQRDMPPASVVVTKATRTMLAPSVDVPGTVISRYDARLASELSAKIVWIAEVGTQVKKGEAVARLEDVTFRLLEMEAASEVQREQARVKFLTSEVRRLERLALDNNAAKSLLEKTASDLAVAESDEAIAEARLGMAKIAMFITEIRAPFDGVVTERLRSIGERLQVADEIIRLVDPDSIEVVARAPLNTINYIAEQDELDLHNDYREGRAIVRTIVPFGDPQSHMFEVRLNVDANLWVVGESVRVPMPTSAAREVLAVPRDALVLRREGASVFRVNADMTAEKISVITGLGAGSLIEVIGELDAGDTIVIRGAERLNTGSPVQITSTVSRSDAEASPKME
jgi:RND family efflux transporter MFP subunit